MKITLEQITRGVDEVIIRYKEKTPKIERIHSYLMRQEDAIVGIKDGQKFFLRPEQIVYLESVDGATFLYTEESVYRTGERLAALELHYGSQGLFRCSKSMIINIYRIQSLKSEPENRIDAKMDNGEHVVISRRYAKELREILKGEKR